MTDAEQLAAIRTDLAEVKTAVALVQSQLGALADHESRIRALEARMWAVVGIAGLLAFVAPFLSRLIP